ncbi:hypothetical protein LTR78_010782 [Recurvomyces mirabilis]|uniref:Diaminopimelate epimerase-like protein n=1 Tax=Recurvomyces mirabilis TaxID=574656 RepID=A0AAE0TMC1_9PEZI|nr:hypothetical protein LTR78_010782 [Recurvomyces mirabilis]KAK5149520.1 hypothetical protein LTS14_010886 [Recurvomyces mirabilis]
MSSLSFVTVDVFTKTKFTGNPLAIVRLPEGRNVSTEQMQMIAREFNLSETVFIHEAAQAKDSVPAWQVRIFLVNGELPFAGHPTIGAACYALGSLTQNAKKGKLHCNAGPIELEFDGTDARASIPQNVHIHTEHEVTIDQVYYFQPAIAHSQPPKAVDLVSPVKGVSFVCVELPSLEVLAQVQRPGIAVAPKLDDSWNGGFIGSYFYVITKQDDSIWEIRTRMIEMSMEDPATGSAACALGAFLALKHKLKSVRYSFRQGVEMGRQSDIGLEVTLSENLDAVEHIELVGSAVKVMEGTVYYK